VFDAILAFLGSEKWERVLGSLVAIATLLGAGYAVLLKMKGKAQSRAPSPALSPLLQIWDALDPALQDAFVLANNERQRLHKEILQTRYLFQAFAKLQNPDFLRIARRFPEDALPDPAQAQRGDEDTVLLDNPPLSTCVTESVDSFLRVPKGNRKITPADMFFDIGQHGHGSCVARLRDHGVDSKRLEVIVEAEGLDILRRREIAKPYA